MGELMQLVAKRDGGFFRAADVAHIDNYLAREWGFDIKTRFAIVIEADNGDLFTFKCDAVAKMGKHIGLSAAMIKHMKIAEGDLLNVRPA